MTGDGWQPYTPPAPQPDDSGMEGLNPRGVDQLFREQPVDVALKAVEAAIQFQGMRGYQQALKDGQPAEKAMARFGPMIFRKTPQAMGPAIRSLTPPPVKPSYKMVPGTNGVPAYFEGGPGQRPVFIPRSAMPDDLTLNKPQVTELPEAPGVKVIQVPGSRQYRVLPGQQPPTVTESVRQVPDFNSVKGTTNAPPTLSFTNRTTRGISGPVTPPPTSGPTQVDMSQAAFDEGARRAQNARTATPQTAAASGGPVQINSQAEYDAFPGGAYIDGFGKKAYKKPKSK